MTDEDCAAAVAETHVSVLVELACQAPLGLAAARIAARRAASGELSDATLATLTAMTADFDRWPEAAVVDTSGELAASLRAALAAAGEPG